MRSSDLRRGAVRCVIALALAALLFWALDFALYPCTFMRNDVHTIVSEPRDVLILGTSNGKMDLDPDSMLDGTGLTGHNACVGGEYPVDAYFLARLALEKQHPSQIVFELDPGYLMTEKEPGNNYLLFYHEFPMSRAKLDYGLATLPDCDFRALLFPFYEYPLTQTIPHAAESMRLKAARDYGTEHLKGSVQEYHENGFIEKYVVAESAFPKYTPERFDADKIAPRNLEYLDRLIALCKERGVRLVVSVMPLPEKTLQADAGWEQAWDWFSDYFSERDVEFYNFNREYYDLWSHDSVFYVDWDGHMNGESARGFSRVFGTLVF